MTGNKRIVLLPRGGLRWKGQAVLVEAAAQLLARGDFGDVAFVLAGDEKGRSSFKAELEASIDSHGACAAGCSFRDTATICPRRSRRRPSRCCPPSRRKLLAARPSNRKPWAARLSHPHRRVSGDRDARAGASCPCRQRPGKRGRGQPACASSPGPWLFEPGNAASPLRFAALRAVDGRRALEALRQRGIERVRREFSKRALQLQSLTVYDRLLGLNSRRHLRLRRKSEGSGGTAGRRSPRAVSSSREGT